MQHSINVFHLTPLGSIIQVRSTTRIIISLIYFRYLSKENIFITYTYNNFAVQIIIYNYYYIAIIKITHRKVFICFQNVFINRLFVM